MDGPTVPGDLLRLAAARARVSRHEEGALFLVPGNVPVFLVMGEPLNRAMLLGDSAIPKAAELRRHAEEAVRVFLASYGADPATQAPRVRRITRRRR